MTTFDDDAGWVALPGFLSPIEVATIGEACEALLDVPAGERWAGDKAAAGTKHLFGLDERNALIDAVAGRRPLITVVDELLGPDHRRDQVSYRNPGPTFGGQYLHADDPPKLTGGPASVATAIVALVDFTETNGAIRVVPGSHRRPDLQRRSGALDHHPEQILLTGEAGTAFVFSGLLLHSGTPNRSLTPRPALQLVWRSQAGGVSW